jgi:hypothetical protein
VELRLVARSRDRAGEPVEQARILLACRRTPSFLRLDARFGVTYESVERCLRARREPAAGTRASDHRRDPHVRHRPGLPRAKDLGYPRELSTTRLLAKHVREHGTAAGHACAPIFGCQRLLVLSPMAIMDARRLAHLQHDDDLVRRGALEVRLMTLSVRPCGVYLLPLDQLGAPALERKRLKRLPVRVVGIDWRGASDQACACEA